MDNNRESEIDIVLNQHFQQAMDEQIAKYEKLIDDSFQRLLSRLKHSDDILLFNGDCKVNEFSIARRKEFVVKVKNIREIIQNEFRSDLAKLIALKYNNNINFFKKDLSNESVDEMTQLFEQLKLTDSVKIDRDTYSDVIDLFKNLDISDNESNADITDLFERLSLSNTDSSECDKFYDSKNNKSEAVRNLHVINCNSNGDNSTNECEVDGITSIQRRINVEVHDLLVEDKSSPASNADSVFKKTLSIDEVDSLAEGKLSSPPDTDSVTAENFNVLAEEKFSSSPDTDSISEESFVLLGEEKFSVSSDTDRASEESLLLDEPDSLIEKKFSSPEANSISEESSLFEEHDLYSDYVSEGSCFSKDELMNKISATLDETLNKYSMKFCSETLANNQKNAAIAFTNFMVDRRLITIESRLSEQELKSMYDNYEIEVDPEISISDQVLTVLETNDIIKKKPSFMNQNNNAVEFEETFFLNRSHDLQVRSDQWKPKCEVLRTLNPGYMNRTALFRCSVCKDCFFTKEKLDDHNISEMHILKTLYLRNRSWFVKNVDYLKISGIPDKKLSLGETENSEISLNSVVQDDGQIYIWRIFELIYFSNAVKMEYGSNCCLEKGDSFKINMKVRFTSILFNETLYPIVLKVSRNDVNECNYLLIEPHFKAIKSNERINCALTNLKNYRPHLKMNNESNKRCIIAESAESDRQKITDAFSAFRSTRKNATIDNWRVKKDIPKYDLPKWNKKSICNFVAEEEMLHAPRISRALKVPKLALPDNHIPQFLQTLLKFGFKTANVVWTSMERELLKNIKKLIFEEHTLKLRHKLALTEHNYLERLHYEMWIEEYQALEEMRSYAQKDVTLLTDKLSENLIGIALPDLSEGRPSLLKGDFIIIKSKSLVFPQGFKKCEGSVQLIEEKAAYVRLHKVFYLEKYWMHKADVEFRFNRTPLKMGHTILDSLKGYEWQQSLFPKSFDQNPKNIQLRPFFNESIAENELQVQAITNIVQNRAYPAPYILFGPPGTGKTATLVEAITQVWSTMETSRICVCASSNTAADVIAKRLLQYVPLSDVIRIYGLSRNDAEIISELQGCCNYDSRVKEVFFPCFNELKRKRIVVMTPVTAGRYILCGITFDYIFMDEAGHALEVDVLIPMKAFLHNTQSSLVLAGDPKQLGPVVRSPYASALGYGMSLLERLMTTCEIYYKDPIRGEYNPKVITKLVNNYRSHESILHISNQQFYENELVAKASDRLISSLCRWNKLPMKGFPIIFHSVKGLEEREYNSPSYFNLKEVDVVEDYVSSLFNSKNLQLDESEVGIISPYRKQVHKIRQRLLRSWPKINVASVEEFQGQERKVIIISTVRSRHELLASDYKYGLGFLKNEKRFNVAVTRAIALLIVIGNPDILQCDPNWREFLRYCSENSAFVGEPASGALPDNFYTSVNKDLYINGFRI